MQLDSLFRCDYLVFSRTTYRKNRIRLFQDYTIPKVTLKHIYQPYINELSTIIKKLNFKQIQGKQSRLDALGEEQDFCLERS